MKRRTRKRFGKLIGAVLAVALLVGSQTQQAFASEDVDTFVVTTKTTQSGDDVSDMVWTTVGGNANARGVHLYNCYIGRSYSSEGLYMEFGTFCSAGAEEIGVSDIRVDRKLGIFWYRVATSNGGFELNESGYEGYASYSGVETGKTYRVCCRHYAYVNGEYIYLDNETDGWEYTY